MGTLGSFTFVLHSHLPYARLAGRWPHGEEWIHEAASETYVPLLQTLYDLKEEGIDFKLTVGITPILAEQLADSLVLDHFDQYLDDKIAAAKRDIEYFGGEQNNGPTVTGIGVANTTGEDVEDKPGSEKFATDDASPEPIDATTDSHLRYLAEWYKDWYESVKDAFDHRFNRDIIGAFRQLAR